MSGDNKIEIKYFGDIWDFDNEESIHEIYVAGGKYEVTAEAISCLMTTFLESGGHSSIVLDNTHDYFKQKPKGVPISIWATNLLLNSLPIYFEDQIEGHTKHLVLSNILDAMDTNAKYRPMDICPILGDFTTCESIMNFALDGEPI